MSGCWEEREWGGGHYSRAREPAEEFRQSSEMIVRKAVVESREIFETDATRDARDGGCLLRERVEVRESPIARLEQPRVHLERVGGERRALGHPHREDEREPGPLLPALAQIVDVGVVGGAGMLAAVRTQSVREQERRVADDEARAMRLLEEACDVGELGVARRELRLRLPHVLEEKARERDAGHRAAREEHASRCQ